MFRYFVLFSTVWEVLWDCRPMAPEAGHAVSATGAHVRVR